MDCCERLGEDLNVLAKEIDFSGVISVSNDWIPVFERAYGLACRTHSIPNRIDTRFGIASGTKGFTAMAIGRLIESGRLKLSSKVIEKIVQPLPRVSPEVTIQHLLGHTSGVADYFDEEKVDDASDFFVDIPWYRLRGPRDYIQLFADEPMKFQPGERFSYSNGGYILLGTVVEDVSDSRFQAFVTENIFAPCGMNDSGFFSFDNLPERTATGYIETDTGWKSNLFNLPIVGASDGGAFATATDMIRFWKCLCQNRIVGEELKTVFTSANINASDPDTSVHYGHGFWVYKHPDNETTCYLEGYDAGVSFFSELDPTSKRVISILSNTMSGAWPLVKLYRRRLDH